VTDRVDYLKSHEPFGKKPKRPATSASWRFTASNSNQLGLTIAIKLAIQAATCILPKNCRIDAFEDAPAPHPKHRCLAHFRELGDPRIAPCPICLQHNPNAFHYRWRMSAPVNNRLEMLTLFRVQSHNVLGFHAHVVLLDQKGDKYNTKQI
jgi:hypothetical protein